MKIAVIHSRKTFYNGQDIYWYQLACHPCDAPLGFLNVPDTELYEYGGSCVEAIEALKGTGFQITEGKEI